MCMGLLDRRRHTDRGCRFSRWVARVSALPPHQEDRQDLHGSTVAGPPPHQTIVHGVCALDPLPGTAAGLPSSNSRGSQIPSGYSHPTPGSRIKCGMTTKWGCPGYRTQGVRDDGGKTWDMTWARSAERREAGRQLRVRLRLPWPLLPGRCCRGTSHRVSICQW